jgi:hypothetical protein
MKNEKAIKTSVLDISQRSLLGKEKDFLEFYKIGTKNNSKYYTNNEKTGAEKRFINYKAKIFYFVNDDEAILSASKDKENEIIFRNNLRHDLEKHLGLQLKQRDMEKLDHMVNPDWEEGDKPTYIQQKIHRYEIFCEHIVTFTLSMIHSLYWSDFNMMI